MRERRLFPTPGIAPIVVGQGPVFQVFDVSDGVQHDISPPYVGMTAFGLSADRSQLIVGAESDGFHGSFNDVVEVCDLPLNHMTRNYFDSGSQVQTTSAFSSENSRIYFAIGNNTVYGENVAARHRSDRSSFRLRADIRRALIHKPVSLPIQTDRSFMS